jgi:uncharacterized protein (TIGR02246 family)
LAGGPAGVVRFAFMEGAVVRFPISRRHVFWHAGAAGLLIGSLVAGCSAPPPRVWEGQAAGVSDGGLARHSDGGLSRHSDGGLARHSDGGLARHNADSDRTSANFVPDITSQPQPFRFTPATAAALDAVQGHGASAWNAAAGAPVPQDFAPADVTAPLRAAPPAPQPPEVAEIRGMMRDYLRAFNRHDPAALAAHWTGGGESIDLASGDTTAGREAVRSVFAALFQQDDSATIDIDVLHVRPIRDDVAVVDGLTRIAFSDAAPAASRFTAVVVKEQGHWLLESVRETSLPADAVEPPGRPLDALGWLVGAWENIGAGVIASADCTWSAGRGFLVRSHALRGETPAGSDSGDTSIPGLLSPGDPRPRETTEIIGWDPDRRVIRSWVFTSTGRFAEGTWFRDGEAWTVHYEGRGRDEGLDCVCRLSPTAAGSISAGDGLVIACDGDALADLLPPACEFLRTARLD